MAQKIPTGSGSDCAVSIITKQLWLGRSLLFKSYPLQHDNQLSNTTKRHFLWHEHLSQIWTGKFFPSSPDVFPWFAPWSSWQGSRNEFSPRSIHAGWMSLPQGVAAALLLQGALCSPLLLSHLCHGVTQNQFCKTAIQIIFFSFIKIKRKQLHKYLEQETLVTSRMQLKVTGNSQHLHPGLKQSCHLCSKMQAQAPSSSARAFSYFPSSIYLKGTVSQTSAPLHHTNQKIFSIWEYIFSG